MAETAKYEVLRALDGDRPYQPGDTREMLVIDAKPLVDLGCLRPLVQKAETPLQNKIETPVTNKSAVKKPALDAK